MGKWATYRKRGGGGSVSQSLPVPVLVDSGGGQLTWGVTGPTPFFVQIEFSSDGINWTLDVQQSWITQPFDGTIDPTQFYRVIGLDSGSAIITQYSNSVFVP